MSLQKKLMNWNTVYVFVLASCLILSIYIHLLVERDAQDEYNRRLEKEGINAKTRHSNTAEGPNEDIDLVYTWVNGSDPKFIAALHDYLDSIKRRNTGIMELNRYFDLGTLKYSLRSVLKHAGWVRHIFLVTNGQVPNWLRRNHPRLTVVTHEEIFTNHSHLPTFASPAIECHLHQIAGLSKKFIYMNDNILLTAPLTLSSLLTIDGKYKINFMNERAVMCNKMCQVNTVNDGYCNQQCFSQSCEWDGDDCKGQNVPPYNGTDKDFMFDSWMGSIMHTYFLLNKHFEPKDRFVAEHSAHVFDKTLINKLYRRFPKEWELTSSHKIRHHLSVQFQFMYIQFLQEMGLIDTTATLKNEKKCCPKVKFNVDNRSKESRIKQMEVVKLELKLKKSQYLTVTNSFTMELSDESKAEIQKDITDFLQTLYPSPSSFEK